MRHTPSELFNELSVEHAFEPRLAFIPSARKRALKGRPGSRHTYRSKAFSYAF